MKYGLNILEFKSVVEVFQNTDKVRKAILFGSRAKGNYRPGSDIDIAIFSDNLSFDDYLVLKINLDELDLLQKIDLVKFESIENPDLIDHINRVGIVIYERA